MTKKILRALRYAPYALLSLPATVSAANINLGLTSDVESALGLGTQDVRVTIARIINVFMGLLGIVSVVIVLYGGFLWMTAGGAEPKIEKAKSILTSAVVGLVIISAGYAITQFVLVTLQTSILNKPPL